MTDLITMLGEKKRTREKNAMAVGLGDVYGWLCQELLWNKYGGTSSRIIVMSEDSTGKQDMHEVLEQWSLMCFILSI